MKATITILNVFEEGRVGDSDGYRKSRWKITTSQICAVSSKSFTFPHSAKKSALVFLEALGKAQNRIYNHLTIKQVSTTDTDFIV